jgi:glyoxylase-like metal-dependent hydrolase (beta-lactamase superfamily II)
MSILDQTSTTYKIGEAIVTRVSEITLDFATPAMLYADWKPELLEEHENWLFPNSWDESRTRLLQSIHTWVVRTPRHTVLIDTATGNDKPRPFIPPLDHLHEPYLDRMNAIGVTPDQVDFVLMTHLHVDHVGWNTQLVHGQWMPTFLRARYFMPKREHEFFASPANRQNPRYCVYEDSVLPVIAAGQAEFVVADGNEVVEGFSYLSTPGHSLDHMSVAFQSQGEEAVFGGDVLHHPLQVYFPHLNSIYCEFADQARNSRRWMLEYATERKAIYFSTHFPESSAGRISRSGNAFAWHYL